MRPRSFWLTYLCTSAVLVALLVVACAPTAATPTQSTQPAQATAKPAAGQTPAAAAKAGSCAAPIKIGMLYSTTGSMALFGKSDKDGAMLMVEQVNSSGGINGCQLDVVAYDPESDPEKAATFAKRLIEQDKVAAIVGPESGWTHGSVAGLVAQAKVPDFTNSGGYDSLKEADREWSFSSVSPHSQRTAIWLALKGMGIKTWAYLSTPDPVGENGLTTGKGIAPALGIELVGDERQPITDKDLTPSLTKLKAKNPGALVVIGSGEWGIIAINNAAQVGLNIPVFFGGGYSWESFQKGLTPEALKNLQLTTAKLDAFNDLRADDPAKTTIMNFVNAFKAKYGRSPGMFDGAGYDGMVQLVAALKVAGPDRLKIKEAAEKLQGVQGVTGNRFTTGPKNHIGTSLDDAIAVKMQGQDIKVTGYMSDFMKKLSPQEIDALKKLRETNPLAY